MGLLRSNNTDFIKLGLYALRKFSLELKGKFEFNDLFINHELIDTVINIIKENVDLQINVIRICLL